jgi:hypothetical protein
MTINAEYRRRKAEAFDAYLQAVRAGRPAAQAWDQYVAAVAYVKPQPVAVVVTPDAVQRFMEAPIAPPQPAVQTEWRWTRGPIWPAATPLEPGERPWGGA